MNREKYCCTPEQFPSFVNESWKSRMMALNHFAGFTEIEQVEGLARQLTGKPVLYSDRFSSHFLPEDLYEFMTPGFSLRDVEFNIWQYMDELGNPTHRVGFRTETDDTIRLAYCEYRDFMPESVGLLVSWVNPQTEEWVFRDVSMYPDDIVIDRRSAVYKISDIEYPVVRYGDPHMHIGLLPKFQQVDIVYDRPSKSPMELGYARLAEFDADERTYAAHEYSYDVDEHETDYRSHVGGKDIETFRAEIDTIFPKDDSLENVELSVWSD